MDLLLAGKRALVTGSSAGIGEAIARQLAAEGAAVAVHGRDVERTRVVAADIVARGGAAHAVEGDLTDDAAVTALVAAAEDALGGVDILINNAGAYPMSGWFDSTPHEWLASYDLDVLSGLRCIQALVPAMIARGWGRVVQ